LGLPFSEPPGNLTARMNLVAWLLILAVAGMSVAHIVLFVRRLRRRQKGDLAYRVKCPQCRRKLRYRTRQIGRSGMCPRCKQRILFPPPPQVAVKR
jgi:DNA-directed RNA polymerase subunit RPC12/RpoP